MYRFAIAAALTLAALGGAHAAVPIPGGGPSLTVATELLGAATRYTFNVKDAVDVTSFHVVGNELAVAGITVDNTEPAGWTYGDNQGGHFSWTTPNRFSGDLTFSVMVPAVYKMLPLARAYLDSPTDPQIEFNPRIPPVPEPEGYGLAIVGIAAIALQMCRERGKCSPGRRLAQGEAN